MLGLVMLQGPASSRRIVTTVIKVGTPWAYNMWPEILFIEGFLFLKITNKKRILQESLNVLPYQLNFWESPGNVESHCAGPEEERNEGVVNDVAEDFAPRCSIVPIFIIHTEAVGDAKKEVTDEGVNEETNCQDRA